MFYMKINLGAPCFLLFRAGAVRCRLPSKGEVLVVFTQHSQLTCTQSHALAIIPRHAAPAATDSFFNKHKNFTYGAIRSNIVCCHGWLDAAV